MIRILLVISFLFTTIAGCSTTTTTTTTTTAVVSTDRVVSGLLTSIDYNTSRDETTLQFSNSLSITITGYSAVNHLGFFSPLRAE